MENEIVDKLKLALQEDDLQSFMRTFSLAQDVSKRQELANAIIGEIIDEDKHEFLQVLINANVTFHTFDYKLELPVHRAAYNSSRCLQMLLSYDKSLIDLPTPPGSFTWVVGTTALRCAVRHLNLECVKVLLDVGCDVNKETENGMSPLYTAIFEFAVKNHASRYEIVEILLRRGASLECVTKKYDRIALIPTWAREINASIKKQREAIYTWTLTSRHSRIRRIIGKDMIHLIASEIWDIKNSRLL